MRGPYHSHDSIKLDQRESRERPTKANWLNDATMPRRRRQTRIHHSLICLFTTRGCVTKELTVEAVPKDTNSRVWSNSWIHDAAIWHKLWSILSRSIKIILGFVVYSRLTNCFHFCTWNIFLMADVLQITLNISRWTATNNAQHSALRSC